jgi:hypothetical protein
MSMIVVTALVSLTAAQAAQAAPSVAINSFTYNPSDSSNQSLILKATNTGSAALDTFAVQLDANGTVRNVVLTVGSKTYPTACQAQNSSNMFPAVQCKPAAGVLAPRAAFTITFAISPAYPANQTNIWFADDKTGANEGNFTGPTKAATAPPPAPKPCTAIAVSPASVPGATQGQSYSQKFSGSGGTGPYTFRMGSGSLPPGTTLASSGALSGTPTAAGSYKFAVDATDAKGCAGARSYSIDVAKASTTGPCACSTSPGPCACSTSPGPCACSPSTFGLRPDLHKKRLRAHRHSFSLAFTWLMACTSSHDACSGTISFRSVKVLAGSKVLPSKRFGLNIKRRTFRFDSQAGKSRAARVQIQTRSRRQLKALFGHTLVYRIVITRGGARSVQTVRVAVTRRGFLR